MKEKTRKLITYLALAFAIVGAIFAIIFAMVVPDYHEAGIQAAMTTRPGLFNVAFLITVAFIAIAIISIIAFLVMGVFRGESKGLLIGLGILVVVSVIAFLLSSGSDLSPVFMEKQSITAGTSKLVGAGCILVYVLVIGALLSMVYVEVSKGLKK